VKILYYNHTGKVSGAERVMLMMFGALDRESVEPVVMCPTDGPLAAMSEKTGVRTLVSRALNARFTWRPDRLIQYLISLVRVVQEARGVIKAERPDIVHANSIRAGLVMSTATVGIKIPVVWHVHDLLPRHPLSNAIRLFAVLSDRNRVVAVSRAVANRFRGQLLRYFERRLPIVTIHNAVDLQRFDNHHPTRVQLRQALGFKADDLLVGIVGQLTPRKGQLELIRGFAEVAADFPNARLLIVGDAIFNGDGAYRDSLQREARAVGLSHRIHFLGPRDDVPALMGVFDLLVVNSHAEPFGLTVIEAMASGTPVLATAVDGICEIVTQNESGWLVAAGDHAQLVAGLRTLLGDTRLRARLGRQGRETAVARFSTNRFLREINSLYAHVNSPNATKETRLKLDKKLATD
jgi:L-malate glycosyltransferase